MNKTLAIMLLAAMTVGMATAAVAQDPYIAEVMLFSGNYAPRGWVPCDGRLLPIMRNQALFAVIGTMYGGDGRTNFAVPDLRGRVPLGSGYKPGSESHIVGETGGSTTITYQNFSPAIESVRAAAPGDTPTVIPVVTDVNKPVDNHSPYLGVNYYMATQGLFPSRN